jgi:hypothetical protein
MVQNDQALLARLNQYDLDFVVIGGVCCVYYGVPMATFDLDICCRFDEGNLKKLEAALRDLDPFHRLTPQKLPFELTPELCLSLKNLYLQTDLGRLDCLSEVLGIGSYDEVLSNSQMTAFSYGEFRFLQIDALIRAKEKAGRERDLAALRHLKPIKEKLDKKKSKSQSTN